ncbi:hypothetical protein DXT90_18325 [Agrobacterium tumefaciens]|nr:hypothetical protein [Agrobacterium tumefaciens]
MNYSELNRHEIEIPEVYIFICAGDVSAMLEMTVQFVLRYTAPEIPVVMGLGNHEAYGATVHVSIQTVRRMTKRTDITMLENDALVFGNSRSAVPR